MSTLIDQLIELEILVPNSTYAKLGYRYKAIYAVAVFLVVTLVTAVFGLLSSTGDEDIENQSKSGLDCWDEIKK